MPGTRSFPLSHIECDSSATSGNHCPASECFEELLTLGQLLTLLFSDSVTVGESLLPNGGVRSANGQTRADLMGRVGSVG